jgi:hypothetical protein
LYERRSATRAVLIITGYASPVVLRKLRESLHDVLVADDPDTFAGQLKDLIGQLSTAFTTEAQATSLAEQQALGNRLAEVARELEELRSARRSDAVALGQSIAEALAPQIAPQQTPALGWKEHRRELERKIGEARSERQTADWGEFVHYRREALRFYRFGWLAIAGLTGLAAIAIGVLLALSPYLYHSQMIIWSVIALMCLAASIALTYVALLSPRARWLSMPLNSARDLENVPGRSGGLMPGHGSTSRNGDPALRYAAAMRADPDDDFGVIVSRIMHEPTAIVRQALGTRLALSTKSYARAMPVVLEGIKRNVSEVVYLLDRPARRTDNPDDYSWLDELPHRLRILAAVVNSGERDRYVIQKYRPADYDHLVRDYQPVDDDQGADLVWSALGFNGSRDPVARAFQDGPAEQMSKLRKVPAAALSRAAGIVSPFERDGLGTYDRLSVIREVDALYLFFEQLRYLLDEESII